MYIYTLFLLKAVVSYTLSEIDYIRLLQQQSELDHEDFETSVRSNLTNAAVKQLLTDHMVMISQNVNISNLKPYLIEHRCISMDDDQPTDSTELAKIISRGGVGAFDSFIDALEHSVREEPGERGHQDLADTLIEAARTRRRSSTASSYTLSRQVSGASNASLRKPSLPIGPPALLPATKVSPVLEEEPRPYMDDEVDRDCHVDIDGPTAPPQISDTNPEPSTEHPFETTGPSPQPQVYTVNTSTHCLCTACAFHNIQAPMCINIILLY